MPKKACPECAKLRKRLQAAAEREQCLCDGIDYLIEEIRRLQGKKGRRTRKRDEER